jgi:hypothetical protein
MERGTGRLANRRRERAALLYPMAQRRRRIGAVEKGWGTLQPMQTGRNIILLKEIEHMPREAGGAPDGELLTLDGGKVRLGDL